MLLNKNTLAIGIVFLFVCSAFIPMSLGINTSITNTREQPTPFSRGKTLYVGGIGPDNYTKIQGAIDDADDGDTVFVYNDSSPYYENVLIDKSINLNGEERDSTIIDGRKKGDVVIVIADWVTIQGFKIIWSKYETGKLYAGVKCIGNHITIYDNYLKDNMYCILVANSFHTIITKNKFKIDTFIRDGWGIWIQDSDNNIISNNDFENCSCNIGITISSSDYNTISNNTVDGYIDRGMVFSRSWYNLIVNNTVTSNNDITSNSGMAILLAQSRNNIISNNSLIRNPSTALYLSNSRNNNISKNIFMYNNAFQTDSGSLYLYVYSRDNEITENYFSHNYGYGIYINAEYNNIKNNIITNNKKDGVACVSLGNTFSGNIVSNNSGNGVTSYNGATITYNIIANNSKNGIEVGGMREKVSSNHVVDNKKVGIILKYGFETEIYENNIINNGESASFKLGIFSDRYNRWYRNYYGKPYSPNKKIQGIYGLRFPNPWTLEVIFIPLFRWYVIDPDPAQEPYDIGVY